MTSPTAGESPAMSARARRSLSRSGIRAATLRVAHAVREDLQQRPGQLGVLQHERLEVPLREDPALHVGLRGDPGAAPLTR